MKNSYNVNRRILILAQLIIFSDGATESYNLEFDTKQRGIEIRTEAKERGSKMKSICICSTIFIIILLLALLDNSVGLANAQDQRFELYMPDGQFIDRPVRVYISGIEDSMLGKPRLCLVRLAKDTTGTGIEYPCGRDKNRNINEIEPFDKAINHQWKREIRGSTIPLPRTCTLFLFNLQDFYIPWYKPGSRILPVLHYDGGLTIVADQEVYISHHSGTIFAVIVIIIPLLVIISFLAREDHHLKGLLSTQDGRMSISLTQMFLWTVAVGSIILAFGLSRLQVPYIPESLVVLMGLSVTTSVTGHWQTDSVLRQIRKTEGKFKVEDSPKFSHLVTIRVPDADDDADLGKAQLLFWTVITLTIFVLKSLAEGQLWNVPPELVVLMGISQAGFLTRKQFIIRQQIKDLT